MVFFAVNRPLVHGTIQLFTSPPFVPYGPLMLIFRSILGILETLPHLGSALREQLLPLSVLVAFIAMGGLSYL